MNPKAGQGSLERGKRRNIDVRRDEMPSFYLRRQNGRDVAFLVLVEQIVDRQRMPKENEPKVDTIAGLRFHRTAPYPRRRGNKFSKKRNG